MKDIYKFANELFNSSGLTVNPSHDIHDLCKEIKINSDAIENSIYDDKLESLSELGLSISSDLDIQDIWKYAAIFYTLNELLLSSSIYLYAIKNVQSTASELSGSWEDAVTILSTKISETNITSDADEKDITDLVDYIIGCMFLGVEAALTDADDEGIEAWVMGFGNPFEYDDPVGDIIMSLDSSIREDLSDTYMQALLSLYFVDVDDYRDDDEGVDWDQVSDYLKQLM
jgi:hypothetical protein